MAVELTLNDFRSVLGNVNDGNVVFKQDQSGIEKANYGNKFLNLFRSVRTAPNDPQENLQVRQSLLSAIRNSSESKVLSISDMQRIYNALGMPDGDFEPDAYSAPLTRRELKNVIDIIDGATKDGALVDDCIDALNARGVLDEDVSNGVKKAIGDAACFRPSADSKTRLADTRQLFGADFNGRSPAEVDKFVRQNMAVIREQVFYKLYWANPSLKDFTAEVTNDAFVDGLNEVEVSEDEVTAAFKEVVGELMAKNAAKLPVFTKIETLAPSPEEVKLLDDTAKTIWDKNVKGSQYENTVRNAFGALAEKSGSFTALQLDNAAEAVVNQVRTTFNRLYTENHFNPQDTEKAFKAAMEPLMSVLDGVIADMDRVGPDTAAKVKTKVSDALGMLVSGGSKLSGADAALTALNDVVKTFSSRGMVEDFVNANYAYLEDKSPVINFFMEKIGLEEAEGGINKAQAEALAKAQKAAVDGNFGADAKRALEFALMEPLKEASAEKVASEDPKKIAELRTTRNANTFKTLLVAMPGYAAKSEAEKAKTLAELKIQTLLGVKDHDFLFNSGITSAPGSEHIRETDNAPAQDALEKLDAELLKIDDRDFSFFAQYAAKGLRSTDSDLNLFCDTYELGDHPSIFKDALRDGTVSISSIPTNAVPLLDKILQAKIFSTSSEAPSVGLRDCLPKGDDSKPLGAALFVRLQTRFEATGIKTVPASLSALTNQNIETQEGQSEACLRLNASRKGALMRMRGFGTLDPARLLQLFNVAGIDLAPLDGGDINAKVDIYEKVFCLSTIAAMSGCKLDGLPEFCERAVGKPLDQVTMTDVFKALDKNNLFVGNGLEENLAIEDPLNKLSGAQKTAKELFAGEIAFAGAKLPPAETIGLLNAARELDAAMPNTSKTLKVAGADVTMTRLPDGALSLKIGSMPMRCAFDTNGLVRMIENEIVAKPGDFANEVVKGALPPIADVESGKVPLVRARELYAKVAAAKTGTLPVLFSAYSTAELREVALKSVDGQFTAANLQKNPPAIYNSGAMIEMHAKLSTTSASEIDSKVKIATQEKPPYTTRSQVPPSAQTVGNIVADLFLNKDTWEFDASATGKAQPGERVRKLLVEHGPELVFIKKSLANGGDGLLAGLAPQVRDAVKAIFADIAKLNLAGLDNAAQIDGATRNALAAIETKIDETANTLVDSMQAKVTELFKPHGAGEQKANWQKTFAEMTGKEGIDDTTRQGKFTMTVLNNYFARSARVDKRAMLSSLIRNTDANRTDAKQVAELLKGAGPLLQKMLQGLPLSSFDPQTQIAMKDMKSRLLPIPDEAVKAQMLELVNSSNGNILSIEVKKSLGAASVGQAFLCTIKTKDHPYLGEECVIKLLRPNVDTAIQREKAMIDSIIGNDPSMKDTFDGQYRKILEEFDLTLESTNVGIGTKVYELPKGVNTVHSMQTLEGSQSTMTSMILKRADGNTFDNLVEGARKSANEILAPLKRETEVNGQTKVVYKADSVSDMVVARRKIVLETARLNDRRNQILDVAKAWFDNALFGNGFFHGDLHGGNLMTGPTGTTFIDFGNCSRLSPDEQGAIKMMLAAVVSGDTSHVVSNFVKLMPADVATSFSRKFVEGGQNMKMLEDVLKRGTSLDLMSRVQAFIAIVQSEDVAVPAPLQNFVQSYVRLCDIADDIDRTVADLQLAANSIYCDVPAMEPVPGESKAAALLKNIVRAYVGDANNQCSAEAIRAAGSDFTAWAATDEGKAELHALSHDAGRIKNELLPLIRTIKTVGYYGRYDNGANPNYISNDAARKVEELLEIFESVEAAGKIQNGKIVSTASQSTSRHGDVQEAKLFDFLERALAGVGADLAKEYVNKLSTETLDGISNFTNIALKIDKSVTDVCSEVISDNQVSLGLSAVGEYRFGVVGFKNRLGKAAEEGEEMSIRMKNVGPKLAEKNLELPPGERLSGQEMATLSRATSMFLVPSPRPDSAPNWGSVKDKRTTMLNAIAYNLSRAEQAMNLGEGKHLTGAMVRHATLNMGLLDKQLVESFVAMSDKDYNVLLLEAQQAGGNLSLAISALRGGSDLLAQVSTAPQPQAAADDDE